MDGRSAELEPRLSGQVRERLLTGRRPLFRRMLLIFHCVRKQRRGLAAISVREPDA